MLYCNKISVSEWIDINKTSASKECNISYYRYFLDKGFKFEPYIYNGCHDVLIILTTFINLNDIPILNMNGANYNSSINGINGCCKFTKKCWFDP